MLESISADHESKGTQLVEAIKSQQSPSGKFGIKSLLIMVAIVALIVSLPELFGVNNAWCFWIAMLYLFYLFAPMLGFFAPMFATGMGFGTGHQKWIGFGVGFLAAFPVAIGLLFWNWNQPPSWIPVWLLQFGAVYIAGRTFR